VRYSAAFAPGAEYQDIDLHVEIAVCRKQLDVRVSDPTSEQLCLTAHSARLRRHAAASCNSSARIRL